METDAHEVLVAARLIADRAIDEGVLRALHSRRPVCSHMGAILADAVLQSGLNYSTVVRPRIVAILRFHPEKSRTSLLADMICRGETALFLRWGHHQKVERFEQLVHFLGDMQIDEVVHLRQALKYQSFRSQLQKLRGIGPKTIDYLACLVGIDSIAVDRHIKTYAQKTGITNTDYHFLKQVFCYAADFLVLPRREFDAWIWKSQSYQPQMSKDLFHCAEAMA